MTLDFMDGLSRTWTYREERRRGDVMNLSRCRCVMSEPTAQENGVHVTMIGTQERVLRYDE
jgi:hypothetical protein